VGKKVLVMLQTIQNYIYSFSSPCIHVFYRANEYWHICENSFDYNWIDIANHLLWYQMWLTLLSNQLDGEIGKRRNFLVIWIRNIIWNAMITFGCFCSKLLMMWKWKVKSCVQWFLSSKFPLTDLQESESQQRNSKWRRMDSSIPQIALRHLPWQWRWKDVV